MNDLEQRVERLEQVNRAALDARITELETERDEAIRDRDDYRGMVVEHQGRITRLKAQNSVIRENRNRDVLRLESERDNNAVLMRQAIDQRDEWKEQHHSLETDNARLREALEQVKKLVEALEREDWVLPADGVTWLNRLRDAAKAVKK